MTIKIKENKVSFGNLEDIPDLLTPKEMSILFGVDPKTVSRWVKAGRFKSGDVIQTPGGHNRFKKHAVIKIMNGTYKSE